MPAFLTRDSSRALVLASGTFTVKRLDVDTLCLRDFTSNARSYTFKMLTSKKTEEGTKDPYKSFNKFVQFALDAFADTTFAFGKYQENESHSPAYEWGPKEVVALLKYSTRAVFICAETIARTSEVYGICILPTLDNLKDSVVFGSIHMPSCSTTRSTIATTLSNRAPVNYAQNIHLVAWSTTTILVPLYTPLWLRCQSVKISDDQSKVHGAEQSYGLSDEESV
ncbi:hypothetical protein BDZ88DRAFT_440498 [Geranomyces variabilis]|nr:hypothetical protein BDZ88DRAFT_440498 [Geranomyces variabilis]